MIPSDIVERLRNDGYSWAQSLFDEAADEIERLEAELKQLRHMYEAAHVDANAAIERQRLEVRRLRDELDMVSK